MFGLKQEEEYFTDLIKFQPHTEIVVRQKVKN